MVYSGDVNQFQLQLGPVLKGLTELSSEEVDAELTAIEKHRARLDVYENALRAVRPLASGGNHGPALDQEPRPTLRKANLKLMGQDEPRGWRPAEMRAALDERGWGPTGKNARNQIQNRFLEMLNRGELVREDGIYWLAAAANAAGGLEALRTGSGQAAV
jgi:hypothetical protein